MKALWPIFYCHRDGRKFAYDEHTVDHDERFTKGRMTLPDCEIYPYPYTIEFERYVTPKLVDGDDLGDIIHNMMVFYDSEDMETLSELKTRAKNGMDVYPNVFRYRFTLAAINLIAQEMASWCNEFRKGIFEHPIGLDGLVGIATLMVLRDDLGLGAEVVSGVVKKMLEGMSYADAFEKSLPAVVAEGELEGLVKEVLAEYPEKVAEWRRGKKGVASMFIGEVMRKKRGLNPKDVVRVIGEELNRV